MAQTKRVLAVASGGGHWVQLSRLRPAWNECQVDYVTTKAGYRQAVIDDAKARGQRIPGFHTVTDANLDQKLMLIPLVLQLMWIAVRVRPHVVISTGAAPGFFAILVGRLIGARTIWLDSIANSEELSLSGAKIGRFAHVWLTQWEHLAGDADKGPHFRGAIL